jgi:hypothetical protein
MTVKMVFYSWDREVITMHYCKTFSDYHLRLVLMFILFVQQMLLFLTYTVKLLNMHDSSSSSHGLL